MLEVLRPLELLEHRDRVRGPPSHIAGELLQHLPASPHEGAAEQKIARQISDQRELGSDGEVGARAEDDRVRARKHHEDGNSATCWFPLSGAVEPPAVRVEKHCA